MNLESERKQAAWREEQRGEELLCADTSMVEGHTKEGLVASDGEILKTKGDSVKIQKDGILQLSEENSCKLLLLASALVNMDSSKKMSECKLHKRLFDSAKQLKLKEFKYDANPSMRRDLFQFL